MKGSIRPGLGKDRAVNAADLQFFKDILCHGMISLS